MPWVRGMRWARAGFGIFAVVGIGATTYGVYRQISVSGTSPLQVVGDALVFWILAMFLALAILIRPQAEALIIDAEVVRLEFKGGKTYVREWNRAGIRLKGRRTLGVRDGVSRGRALWSIYGRFGGLSETFIPEAAFNQLVTLARGHSLRLVERSGRPGWSLYTFSRS